MARAEALRLAELVDLEAQLEADRALDLEALRKRDRPIGVAQGEASDRALVRGWIQALRGDGGSLGESLVRGGRLLAALLALFGLASGAGAARVLMHFDGSTPVNVLPILGVLVAAQLALVVLVVLSVALGALGLAPSVPLAGDVRAVLRGLAARLADRSRRRGGEPARWVATLHRLRARSRLHEKLELWWLTLIAQSFGIAFNVGALAVMIAMPAVLKYSFCWSTTLELGPEALHRITTLLSLPWRPFAPGAVPTFELVRDTQFDLLSGRYAAGAAPGSGAWWPFLVACVAVYGLLPRVALAITSALLARRSLDRIPLDTPDVEAVLRRLRAPRVETRGPQVEARPERAIGAVIQAPIEPPPAPKCTVIAWRDLPLDRPSLERWLSAERGWQVSAELGAGGADFAQDARAVSAAAEAKAPVIVAAEAYEPPDKAVRRFLASLRQAIGPRLKLVVLLVGARESGWGPADASDADTWTAQLAALEDPYLTTERAP